MDSNATGVPVHGNDLAQRLAIRAEAAKAKHTPQPSPHKVIGELDEDKDDLCIIIPKSVLLDAVGPGNSTYRNQEGANLAVDGTFTYVINDKAYRFHLRLFPAWMRVDMLVK